MEVRRNPGKKRRMEEENEKKNNQNCSLTFVPLKLMYRKELNIEDSRSVSSFSQDSRALVILTPYSDDHDLTL